MTTTDRCWQPAFPCITGRTGPSIFAATLSLTAIAMVAPDIAYANSVELYGVAAAGLSVTDLGGATSPILQVTSGVASTSRIGFRGSEELGGGLKAFFNLEGQINLDEGTGTSSGALAFTRRSVVGLEGRYGQLTIGRDYTPGYHVAIGNDTFRYGMWGSTIVFSAASGGLSSRASNGIYYKSPRWSGFEARAFHASGERYEAPRQAGNLSGAGIFWSGGAWNIGVYYHEARARLSPTVPRSIPVRQYGIGAGWRAGDYRLNAGYAVSDPAGGNNALSLTYFGGGVRIGAGELMAQVLQQRLQTMDAKGTTLGVAYSYPFSKRSDLYATAGRTRNGVTASFALNSAGNSLAPMSAGQDVTAYGIGIRHRF